MLWCIGKAAALAQRNDITEIKVLLHAITVKSKEKLIERMCERNKGY
jgi:hypothetical protein